jgi:hypothetical protein
MKSFYLLSTLVTLGVANLAIPVNAQEDLSSMCAREQELIEEVTTQGIGDRYILQPSWEIPSQPTASSTVARVAETTVAYQSECPEDSTPLVMATPQDWASSDGGSIFGGGASFSALPPEQWGHGSVIRYKGVHRLGDFRISGDSNDPLSFIFLSDHGLVYLHGTGRVIEPDGEEVNF